uniref:TIL domain-containing protein n=1 Tax=Glossina pallidipes TaxID=7398 RepID=A0A1B0ABL7_GLOPL
MHIYECLRLRDDCGKTQVYLKCGPPCPPRCTPYHFNINTYNHSLDTDQSIQDSYNSKCVILRYSRLKIFKKTVLSDYCEDRQVYLKCGPSCPPRCRPYTYEECPPGCVEGCFCKKRYN